MTLGFVRENAAKLLARRELLSVLIRKRLKERHLGTVLGGFWSFYTALFPLAMYVLVFFFIARVQVPGVSSPWEYLVFVYSGLVPWLFFSRVTTESVPALSSSLDLLRQAIFPMEAISIVDVSERFVHFLLQTAVLVLIACVAGPGLSPRLLLLPVACGLLYLFCLGLAWIVSLVGFYLQDLKEILSTLTQFLIFVTPVLYARENAPSRLHVLFDLNPLTHVVNVFRDLVYHPHIEHPASFAVFAALSVATFATGYLMALSAKSIVADLA
jgi:lipopolysaccharide transport system permease protein